MMGTLNQDPVYERTFFYLCNPFTRIRANSVIDCNTCLRTEIGKVARVPCKQKADPPSKFVPTSR